MSKIAVITGASSGIGFHLSRALLASNVDIKVVAIGRRGDLLDELCLSNPDRVEAVVADVATLEGRDHIIKKLSAYPQIDYLVHAAATVHPLSSIKNLSLLEWRKSLCTNVEAPLFLTQSLLNKFNRSKVLFFTSEPHIQPVPGASAYCVSKAGQQMVYESFKAEVSMELAAFGMVSPGLVDTPMQADIRQADPVELPAATELSQLYTANKLLSADTVARFVKWLLLTVEREKYSDNIWDINDESHHFLWMS